MPETKESLQKVVESIEWLEDEISDDAEKVRKELLERLLNGVGALLKDMDEMMSEDGFSSDDIALLESFRGRGIVFGRGLLSGSASDLDEGIHALSRAVKLNPSLWQAWLALGRAFWAKNELSEARRCLGEATIRGGGASATWVLASLLRRAQPGPDGIKGSRDLAKSAARAGIPEGWHELGLTHLSSSMLSPSDRTVAGAKSASAELASASKAFAQAARLCSPLEERILAGTVTTAQIAASLAAPSVERIAGSGEERERDGDRGLPRFHLLPHLHHNRGEVCRFREDFEGALGCYARALALEPKLTESRETVRRMLSMVEATVKARETANRAQRRELSGAHEALWGEKGEAVAASVLSSRKPASSSPSSSAGAGGGGGGEEEGEMHRTTIQEVQNRRSEGDGARYSRTFLVLRPILVLPRSNATPAVLLATDGCRDGGGDGEGNLDVVVVCLYGASEDGVSRLKSKRDLVILTNPTPHQAVLNATLAKDLIRATTTEETSRICSALESKHDTPSTTPSLLTYASIHATGPEQIRIVSTTSSSIDWEKPIFTNPSIKSSTA